VFREEVTMDLTEGSLRNIADEMLKFFGNEPYPAVEITKGPVTVEMNMHYQMTSVRLADRRSPELEAAILNAVNSATRAVTERNGRRLSQAIARHSSTQSRK
jgi:hypothetical protein